MSKKVFTYDSAKNYFEFVETYSYNSPVLRVGFRQDERCRFAEVIGFGRDGKVARRNMIEFDRYDNPITIISYTNAGTLLERVGTNISSTSGATGQSRQIFRGKKKTVIRLGFGRTLLP